MAIYIYIYIYIYTHLVLMGGDDRNGSTSKDNGGRELS